MSWLSSSRCGCVMRPSKKRPHLRVSSVGGVAEHIPLKDESCSHAWLSTVSITFMIYWLERWISVAFSSLAAASSFEARFADGQTESRGYVSSLLLGRWPVPLAGGQEHSGKPSPPRVSSSRASRVGEKIVMRRRSGPKRHARKKTGEGVHFHAPSPGPLASHPASTI
jgi:hypothetical protein